MNSKVIIAIVSTLGIGIHLILRFALHLDSSLHQIPLYIVLAVGGAPLIYELFRKVLRKEFGADLLAGISIITSILLGEYLAGTIVVLMLSGGEALESYALARASSVLLALAKRMPSIGHLKIGSTIGDVALDKINIGDNLVVFPHEVCPVDGTVTEGHSTMDESFLTGEPFHTSKTTGSSVISGSVNGENALVIEATKLVQDSRYAKITQVMHESEQRRPQSRRLGDKLGAWYTPVALIIATLAGVISGDPIRFLSVLVVATPCPLLIAIPVAIIGSISLAARQSIIIKNPVALEQISDIQVAIFDKTGTLTFGQPQLIDMKLAEGFDRTDVLALAASIETYSKHPLSHAILKAAKKENLHIPEAHDVSEKSGEGLTGVVNKRKIKVTSRKKLLLGNFHNVDSLPPTQSGLECVILIDDHYAATMRFHDSPRTDSKAFISHLSPRHKIMKGMIISGDRESEVKYLAEQVGIKEIYAQKSPEEKVEIVRAETLKAKTLYIGDGINDAPAMMAATVGIGMGQNSEVTSEAADVIILDSSLLKVDQFMHISKRMKLIILQSAIGGMILSILGMGFASFGYLTPVAGALFQEVIDVLAVLNALRAAFPPKVMSDLNKYSAG